MRRRVHLHGIYASFADGPIEVVSNTVAEAIAHVSHMLPGFKPDPINGRKRAVVAGCSTKADFYAPSDREDIHVFPPMAFGKNGGLIQIVIGAVLIAAAFIPGIGNIAMAALLGGGISMMAGGLLQLIMPQPKNTAEVRSKYIAETQNTVLIGTPIPILYGRYRCGGQILSLSVTSQNQAFSS